MAYTPTEYQKQAFTTKDVDGTDCLALARGRSIGFHSWEKSIEYLIAKYTYLLEQAEAGVLIRRVGFLFLCPLCVTRDRKGKTCEWCPGRISCSRSVIARYNVDPTVDILKEILALAQAVYEEYIEGR